MLLFHGTRVAVPAVDEGSYFDVISHVTTGAGGREGSLFAAVTTWYAYERGCLVA